MGWSEKIVEVGTGSKLLRVLKVVVGTCEGAEDILRQRYARKCVIWPMKPTASHALLRPRAARGAVAGNNSEDSGTRCHMVKWAALATVGGPKSKPA